MLKTCLNKLYELSTSYYQVQNKVILYQTDSIMTLNCELCQSKFLVLSGRFIIKLSKMCFLCTYIDQMIIQQRFNVFSNFSFTIFSMFFPLFPKAFTDILQVNELPKISLKYLNISKHFS